MGEASEAENDRDKSDDLMRFIWGTTEGWDGLMGQSPGAGWGIEKHCKSLNKM